MRTVLVNVRAIFFFLVLCPAISVVVTAQNPDNSTNTNGYGNNNQYPYARFSPSMAVIIVILIAALFFMGFFSIYIRHCSDSAEASGRARRGPSVRGRRAEAARGLDASVIESFPTFTYAEVKDHKIGKGALECAVCLTEFEEEETLRLLPKCDHVFHPECVDAWLASHVTCPVCRANLVPQAGDEAVPQIPESTVETEVNGGSVRRTGSSVVVQIDDDHGESQTTPRAQSQGKDNSGFDFRNRSIKLPRMLSFSRFRSHSTGHDSVVRPGENLDRFTLRLPADVRRDVMHRAALNRTRSCAVTLPREGSSRRGYRNGGEGSSRAGRFFRRMDTLNRDAKSDRWVFFTRVFSMKSPRAAAEASGEGSKDGGSVGGRTAVKLPSFKCLEPSVGDSDEVRLISGEPVRSSPV